jgi:hypothetical protein
MDTAIARKTWRTLEPYHGLVYFAPEPVAAYARIGIEGRTGYFASRAAPMGAVATEVVQATFFNFHPELVRAAMEGAWSTASPDQVLAARLDGADAALRAVLGDEIVISAEVAEGARLAREAARACTPEGRPLFAGHASLPWPDAPHLALWHAISILREYRGDGHIACLTVEGLDGCEALVVHGASGEVAPSVLQASRAWPDDEWAAASDRLVARGWIDGAGALTPVGLEGRQRIEDRTDALAMAPWEALGEDACERLRSLVRPWSKAIVASGTFGFRPDPAG